MNYEQLMRRIHVQHMNSLRIILEQEMALFMKLQHSRTFP